MSCSLRTIVCQEVFDENSAPSEEEVKDYAWKIGINPETEPHLLHYAREGLMQALPENWKPCFDTNVQAWYYYNTATRQSQWEHPLDEVYRSLIKKVRSESISSAGEDDSKTSAKEDLRSYEESADPSVEATSKTMDSSRSMSLRKANVHLNPLKKFSPTEPVLAASLVSKTKEPATHAKLTPSSSRSYHADDSDGPNPPRIDLTVRKDASSTGAIKKDYTSPGTKDIPPGFSPRIDLSTANLFKAELRPKKEIPSPTARIDIDKMTVVGPLRQDSSSRREKLQSAQEKHPRGMTGRGELTLTGGGSIFLKSKDKQEPQSPGQISATTPTPTEGLEKQLSIEVISQSRDDSMPKSILRDQKVVPARQLWDVDPRQMTVEEKQLWRRQELDEERKSVRFNLDKALDIHFTVSESDHSEQEGDDAVQEKEEDEDWNSEEEDPEEERIIMGMKASVPVQDASDGSDRDEMSPKIIDNIFPADDRIETQISRHRSGKERASSLFQKVDVSSNSKIPGKLSEIYFPKERMKNKITSNIFDDTSQLSDFEGRVREGLGMDRVVSEVATKEQIAEVEDVETKQDEDKWQCLGSVVNREVDRVARAAECLVKDCIQDPESSQKEVAETVILQKEKMAQELSETLKQLQFEHERCRQAAKLELSQNEQQEKERMLAQMEERLALFKSSIQTQQEAQETSIREKMEMACEALKVELAANHQQQLEQVRTQYEQQLQRERTALEEQLVEVELELAGKRESLCHERAVLDKQLGEIQRELDSRKEALDHERATMEAASTQQLETLSRQLEEQNREKLATLRKELDAAHQAQLEEARRVLAADLEAKRAQLTTAHQEELEAARQQLEAEHRQACEQLRSSCEEELEGLKAEHEAALLELREEHLVSLEALRTQLRQEEEVLRREHLERTDDLRVKLGRDMETDRARGRTTSELLDNVQQEQVDNSRMFEKLRCEKRLLEDKYRSLKEKYIRLKTEVKISIERRKKRDGGATTGSETERSSSHKTGKSSEAERLACDAGRSRVDSEKRTKKHSAEGLVSDNNNESQNVASLSLNTSADERQPSIVQEPKNLLGQLSLEGHDGVSPLAVVDSDNRSSTSSNHQIRPPNSTGTIDGNVNRHRRRQLFGHPRPSSAVNRASNNNDNSSVDDLEEDLSPSISPVENLRRQLQKLEDLEDQFPASTHTDTYLRYPFTDTGQFGSSEMEFFRHRIHLERDSVRRAKDFLRVQRTNFLSRQRELKQRQLDNSATARNMLDQLYQEERELTDMEVSLHRTRGLLGEKIIRLRHLEQSLYRAAEQACPTSTPTSTSRGPEDQTLSDLSSHSGSSGFSSTEVATDTGRTPLAHGDHYQESSEIIQSLENLNSEIREIWEVLHKQQEGTNMKPVVAASPLVCGDMAWPTLLVTTASLPERVKALRQQAQQNLTAMAHFSPPARPAPDPVLAERARSLREWLRQARLESAQL